MTKRPRGSVRIIAGKWRGTRLSVPDQLGLRPSGDRSRETLFNWLQANLYGARCADLFAGSGALGLEAASRGAASVTLIEKSRPAAAAIRQSVEKLGANTVQCIEGDALEWLKRAEAGSLDIVFIDPPFGSGLEPTVLELLESRQLVADGGFVYIESARSSEATLPGEQWILHREKLIGEVRMQLLKKI